MTNLEKYDKAFVDSLEIDSSMLKGLKYQDIGTWDSVGHMTLISEIEDAFAIEIDTEDIIDFSSYEHGKEILGKYGIELKEDVNNGKD